MIDRRDAEDAEMGAPVSALPFPRALRRSAANLSIVVRAVS
jgi:hypothetical protein